MSTLTMPNPRRRPRALGVIAAAVAIAIGSYAVAAFQPAIEPADQPAHPPVPTMLPEPIDAGGAPVGSLAQIDHSIEAWSRNLETNPTDFLAATNLAALFHGRARLSYDLGDYERAQAAAQTALRIAPSHGSARALEAAILFSLHDFAGAFATADALVREDPSQLGALATRFDAAVELGRLDDARIDLERLRDVGGAAVLVREARFASATGDVANAVERAREARDAAIDDEVDDPGFYAYALGEFARLAGNGATSRAAFDQALVERDDDVGALIGRARVDAYDGRTSAAIDGLRRATAIAPQPEALALLGDLLDMAGQPGATDAFETVRFIARLGDIQASTYDRQLLRFELDHDGATVDLLARARASLRARPDWTGHDTVAWALYRLGRLDEAAASIDAARALGADGARLRYHDGAIRVALGNATRGRELVRSALDLGPALDPIEREEAQRILG